MNADPLGGQRNSTDPFSVHQAMQKKLLSWVGRAALWTFAAVGLAATLLVAGTLYTTQIDHPPELRTRALLTQLVSALEFYRLDNGHYPNSEQGVQALLAAPTSPPPPKAYPSGGYLKSPEMVVDQWGRPFLYKSDGQSFSLASLGADGKRGGNGSDSDLIEGYGAP